MLLKRAIGIIILLAGIFISGIFEDMYSLAGMILLLFGWSIIFANDNTKAGKWLRNEKDSE